MKPVGLGDTIEARVGMVTWDAVVVAVRRTGRVIAQSAGFRAELTPSMVLAVKAPAPFDDNLSARLARARNTGW